MLLGAIVQVAFDASSLGVGGRDQASPRRLQLGRLPAQLPERFLERRVEVRFLQRHAELPRHLFEGDIYLGREAFALASPLGHDKAEQLTAVADRRNPQTRMVPAI